MANRYQRYGRVSSPPKEVGGSDAAVERFDATATLLHDKDVLPVSHVRQGIDREATLSERVHGTQRLAWNVFFRRR
jgi:hypothetical protein